MTDDTIRVLLVEDSAPDARLLVEALREVGARAFELVIVSSLKDALARVAESTYDVALLDLTLPDSTGLTTFRRMQAGARELPIVVLTGLDDETVAVKAVQAGAQDYIKKSEADGHVLVRAMRYAIERQRMLRELEAREASFRIIVHNADGLVVVDGDGVIRFANPATAAILDRSVDQLIGSPFGFELAIGEETDFDLITADGLRVVETRVRAIEWEGEGAALASLRDITDKRTLEEQLIQAQKMEVVGRMAGGLAHDFNNILIGVTGHVELARLDVADPLALDEHFTEIDAAADRATRLIRQLLAFSRKEAVEPKVLPLNAVVAESEKMLRRLVGEEVEIVTTYASDLPPILADRAQIEQVIMNLAVNASDAIELGGTLRIDTQLVELDPQVRRRLPGAAPGEHVLLSVVDDGVGMDRVTLKRMFEPFYTTKDPGKGTGLGLSTVFGIVRRFGGHILVDSAPGVGTTFRIFFEPRDELPAPGSDAPVACEVPRGTEHLLVVDDDATVRHLLARVLGEAGYRVDVATDGADALARSVEHSRSIDLLVSDLRMPEVGGPELYSRLRDRNPEMRAIFISGHPEEAIERDAELLDGLPILQKPFRLADIARKVRDALDA